DDRPRRHRGRAFPARGRPVSAGAGGGASGGGGGPVAGLFRFALRGTRPTPWRDRVNAQETGRTPLSHEAKLVSSRVRQGRPSAPAGGDGERELRARWRIQSPHRST